MERVARVARRRLAPRVPRPRVRARCATGSSRGSGSTGASRTRAPRSTRSVRERTLLVGFSMGGAVAVASRPSRPSRPSSASRRGSPTASTLDALRGKRLDVLHGSLDRWLPGIPGVIAGELAPRLRARARRSASRATYTIIPGARARARAARALGPAGAAAARRDVGAARRGRAAVRFAERSGSPG